MIKYSFENKTPKGFVKISLSEGDSTEIVKHSSGEKEIILGVGKFAEITRRKLILLARKVVAGAKQNKIKKLHVDPAYFDFPNLRSSPGDLGELLAVNFEMANFEFVKYKTAPPEGWNFVTDISFTDTLKGFSK